jgi:RimJ/RimL family protein N-acetyltransferase
MNEQDPSRAERIEIDAGIDGIVLRQLGPEDAQRYFDLVDYDREHFKNVGEPTADNYKTVEAVRRSIINPKWEDTDKVRFGIWENGIMVGSINYKPLDKTTVELGYWVGKEYVGHAYASKAVQTLVPHLFSQGWRWVEAWAAVGNDASRKTLHKAGFTEYPEPDKGQGLVKFELQNPNTA